MYKLVILMCFTFLLTEIALSQEVYADNKVAEKLEEEFSDRVAVYLIDGSILLGYVKEVRDLDFDFQVIGGQTIAIKKRYVENLRIEEDLSFTRFGRFSINKGFYFTIYPISIGIGRNTYEYCGQFILGYRFDKRFAAGFGTGLMLMEYSNDSSFYYLHSNPFFVHFNYTLKVESERPYVFAKLGYAVNRRYTANIPELDGSIYSNFGLGLVFPARRIPRFTAEVGTSIIPFVGARATGDTFRKVVTLYGLKIGVTFGQ